MSSNSVNPFVFIKNLISNWIFCPTFGCCLSAKNFSNKSYISLSSSGLHLASWCSNGIVTPCPSSQLIDITRGLAPNKSPRKLFVSKSHAVTGFVLSKKPKICLTRSMLSTNS
ncbi:hypothetical protein [Kochikohdavirus PBEF19]|uniref:Uncharacterized protein n=1 Tax=Enterococcus phage PBEF129 TaxID=2696337 RepID=A0A7T3JE54_9CAUD|nr:hypothetical protein [Enterococcus phage PBEF129]